MSELGRNAGSSGTSSLVIAGRLILLLLAGAATVWAFSGARDRTPSGGGEHVHVHGASAAAERDQAAGGPQEHGHAHHGAEEHEHAAGDPGPAASPVFTVPESANPRDTKAIGTAQARVFALSVRAPAWLEAKGRVTAVLRNDELGGLSPGEHAFFFRATAPAEGIDVRLSAEPPAPWDASTSRVRFRFDAGASGLEPGGVGWLELAARPRKLLVVPSSAVLYSPQGPYVLAAGADGRSFSTRRVEIGRVSRGLAVVISGLREGEPIVVGSTFSWDAERRLHQAGAGVLQ